MKFDPEQHEFINEVREPRKGELFWYGYTAQVLVSEGTLGIPAPIIIPRRRTILWAWQKMAGDNEGNEMLSPDFKRCRVRHDIMEVYNQYNDEWVLANMTTHWLMKEGWTEPASAAAPAPGTLAWAKATVAAGGAVWWNGYPCEKYDANGLLLPGGRRSRDTYMLIAASGWHPWGDREWLAALPDGTRVRHEMHGIWVKCDGWWLIRTVGGVQTSLSIKHAADSGWDLDREPAPRDLASQLAELERRVAALEGKA